MKKKNLFKTIMLLSTVFMFVSCSLAKVDGDEEMTFVKAPWFFGKGGVSNEVLTEGSTWKVFTTKTITQKNVPIKYEEKFDDAMSDDNTPVDFQAYIILEIEKGKSNILYRNYGLNWYQNNVRETFRQAIRNKASIYPMYDLTSNREVCEMIGLMVDTMMNQYFSRLNSDKEFPVRIKSVIMDRARPNEEVMEEINKTAAQIQSKRTQEKKGEMEIERAKTELKRAVADKAYQQQMNLSADQFIQVKALEMEMQKVEMVRNKQNVNVDVMFGNALNTWDIKRK